MIKYGRSSNEGKWHFLTDKGRSRCSSVIAIRQQLSTDCPPSNLCERCEGCERCERSNNLSDINDNKNMITLSDKKAICSYLNLVTSRCDQNIPKSINNECKYDLNVSGSMITKQGDMREELWQRYYRKFDVNGMCYLCHKSLKYEEYVPGKVKSNCDNYFSNNRPLCKDCYRDLGDNNMDEFKKERHPKLIMADRSPMKIEWFNDYIIQS